MDEENIFEDNTVPKRTDYLKWHPVRNRRQPNLNKRTERNNNGDKKNNDVISPNRYRHLVIDDESEFSDEFTNNVKVYDVNVINDVRKRKLEVQEKTAGGN